MLFEFFKEQKDVMQSELHEKLSCVQYGRNYERNVISDRWIYVVKPLRRFKARLIQGRSWYTS